MTDEARRYNDLCLSRDVEAEVATKKNASASDVQKYVDSAQRSHDNMAMISGVHVDEFLSDADARSSAALAANHEAAPGYGLVELITHRAILKVGRCRHAPGAM